MSLVKYYRNSPRGMVLLWGGFFFFFFPQADVKLIEQPFLSPFVFQIFLPNVGFPKRMSAVCHPG